MHAFRDGLRGEMEGLRGEMEGLRGKMEGLQGEMRTIKWVLGGMCALMVAIVGSMMAIALQLAQM